MSDCDVWPMTCWEPPEDPIVAATLWEAACDGVWAVTGRSIGVCLRRVWASVPGVAGESCLPTPMLMNRAWINVIGSMSAYQLRLPGPVREVMLVKVDGAPIVDWRLRGDTLYRDAPRYWPTDFNRGSPRVYVEYKAGDDVPPVALLAAAELATEMAKACAGDVGCRLPANVISVVRQGVTQAFVDPTALVNAGLWGLPRVDAAIRLINPTHLVMRSAALSPDMPRIVRAAP